MWMSFVTILINILRSECLNWVCMPCTWYWCQLLMCLIWVNSLVCLTSASNANMSNLNIHCIVSISLCETIFLLAWLISQDMECQNKLRKLDCGVLYLLPTNLQGSESLCKLKFNLTRVKLWYSEKPICTYKYSRLWLSWPRLSPITVYLWSENLVPA